MSMMVPSCHMIYGRGFLPDARHHGDTTLLAPDSGLSGCPAEVLLGGLLVVMETRFFFGNVGNVVRQIVARPLWFVQSQLIGG